jgi:hypothetical protein
MIQFLGTLTLAAIIAISYEYFVSRGVEDKARIINYAAVKVGVACYPVIEPNE